MGAFSLVLSRFPQISEFVDTRQIKWALVLLMIAVATAIPARLMAAQVAGGTAVYDDIIALIEKNGPFGGPAWQREYLAGLLLFLNRLMAARMSKWPDIGPSYKART